MPSDGTEQLWNPTIPLKSSGNSPESLFHDRISKRSTVAGITFSIGNLCGVVIGARYGWPKNILHWKGIQESILDMCATVPVQFVIADGIVAMEGNGPLNGTPRALGKIVFADDLVAADATCARLMGLEPGRIIHLREGSRFLGNAKSECMDQVGETASHPVVPFSVVPEFQFLQTL